MNVMARLPAACVFLSATANAANAQSIPLPPAPAGVQTFTRQGFQFAAVQTAGVLPAPTFPDGGEDIDVNIPSFAISRAEITETQWSEFHNAFVDVQVPSTAVYASWLNDALAGLGAGVGNEIVGHSSLGRPIYQTTALSDRLAIRSQSWVAAAAYINWLHNDRQVSIEAITNGAYDLRNVEVNNAASFGAVTRQPGARFWLPSVSEWSLASFWDPNHPQSPSGGWWPYLNRRDRLPIGGLPPPEGNGETSYGVTGTILGVNADTIPIGAYANSQSAWGLLDTSGGSREWTDTSGAIEFNGTNYFLGSRFVAGTTTLAVRSFTDSLEQLRLLEASTGFAGFRFATSIPSPSASATVFALLLLQRPRRTRSAPAFQTALTDDSSTCH